MWSWLLKKAGRLFWWRSSGEEEDRPGTHGPPLDRDAEFRRFSVRSAILEQIARSQGTTGARIRDIAGLRRAREAKQSVICPGSLAFGRPRTAEFMLTISGDTLQRKFDSGMFIYKQEEDRDGESEERGPRQD